MTTFYRVEITKVDTVPDVKREWKQVSDKGNPHDGGAIYEYVTYDGTQRVEREILKQEVETCDVAAVIRAVNGL